MATLPKAFIGPGLQRCLVYGGELYFAARPEDTAGCSIKPRKRKLVSALQRTTPAEDAAPSDQSAAHQLQHAAETSNRRLTHALVKQQELESAVIWDKSLHLASQACSSRPDLFSRAVMRCFTEGGARRSEARLLDELANVFIESLVVYGSPLGNLPPLETWPAPCLLTWRVDGSNYTAPRSGQGLAEYLGYVADDEWHVVEQQSAWMRCLKPALPRFVWLHVKELLVRQKKALDLLVRGQSAEQFASVSLNNAEREAAQRRNRLGNYQDNTLLELEQRVRQELAAYQDLQRGNAGLLDWYRTTSFVLTGHTASIRPLLQSEYPSQATLDSSVFGADCLEELTSSTAPFFVKFDGWVGPAWGIFWDWVLTGGLKQWLPEADSLGRSLELLRDRELGAVLQQWEDTRDGDRFQLLKSWLSGPGAIFPARVAGMVGEATLPPVSETAPIHRQLRVVNPWRADCVFQPRDEALFGLPGKS
ncbi:hypothetical protein KFL_003500170, partial [Klebsormidium nitens]